MTSISEALALAVRQHQAGQLQAAEQIYRQILSVEPNHAEALHLLGVIASQVGQNEIAIEYIGRAVRLKEHEPAFHNNLGEAYRALRNVSEASACYRRALGLKPDYAEAHNNLGSLFWDHGKVTEAVACFRRALELKPGYAVSHYNLGKAHQQQGKLDEAVASFRRALEFNPHYSAAHNSLGLALNAQGKADAAIDCYRRALQLTPDAAEVYLNLGDACRSQGMADEAIACYLRALELQPDYAAAHNNLGNAFQDQGMPAEAVACYRRALELEPDHVAAYNNLGNALQTLNKLDEAVVCFRRVLELEPDYAASHNNLGNAYLRQGKLDDAVTSYRRAVELQPNYAEAHNNLGSVFHELGKLEDAIACFRRAIDLRPDFAEAHHNLSLVLLLAGNFEQGWLEYEWRRKKKDFLFPAIEQPLWDGGPLQGRTILLHDEQGLGDTLQFLRYAPLVKARGGRVLVACPPALTGILSRSPGIDELVCSDSLPPFDVYAPLLSLPALFQTTLETIPANVPYLFADPNLVQAWRQKLESRREFKIGIAWQGSPRNPADQRRSFPLDAFSPLARLEGVRLYSLQKGPGTGQLRALADQMDVEDLGSRLDESGGAFMETAAVMRNLDLVVTADTSIAHLAGGLGVPVWVALMHVPDWRWLLHGEGSLWYPSMRLFRQVERGNWADVFARIARAVRHLLPVQ